MISLKDYIYICESRIDEGGLGGHMAHPIDYTDLSCQDLNDMVNDLFSGKVEHMKEKLDGTNIQATVNTAGEVVFIRNKGDLNSDHGGMTVRGMAEKWADKPSVAKNYIKAGEVITKIFSKVSNKFFNPDSETRVIVNCECISAGQTNVMIYSSDRVAFHGTATYRLSGGKWQLDSETEGEPQEIRKAADGIAEAAPRPDLVLKDTKKAARYAVEMTKHIRKIFSDESLGGSATIGDYKYARYMKLAPEWARDAKCYARIVDGDKSVNLRVLRKEFPELPGYEKSRECKQLLKDIMEPLDTVFSSIGDELISVLDGFTNGNNADTVKSELVQQLDTIINNVEVSGTEEMREVLRQSIARLEKLASKANAAEGIVFTYKGKLMKLTGSFSALNQIFGIRFMKK